ncbi:MAG: ATP-binding cassette domain-containing protein [Deltaproteobacteria bacterium]|nr:ATP-binding cassette domain-containing protein [Deltaproteobacteria bacterium]
MQDILVEFKDVTKRFDTRTILDKINLKIYDNQVTTIIGKSGTGKSVLLKHIIGLLAPTEGTISFRGKPIHTLKKKELEDLRSQFSYCFQNNALFDSLTVYDNIALPLRQTTKLGKKEIQQKVMDKVSQMELSDVTRKFPSEISGGMQKRVALARALITDPKIVLFDEPTTGQDPIRKNAILGMISQNQRKFGFTTIMISHEIPDVFFISDRILILYDGKIIFQGTYHELDHLDHPMVDEFVKSLEGFQDELTGLHSKKGFESVYEKQAKEQPAHETVAVMVFTLESFDELDDKLGNKKTQEVIQALGETVNKHFGQVGISTRIASGRIATILPNTDHHKAVKMLDEFSRDLLNEGLAGIQAETITGSTATGYSFTVSAGWTEGQFGTAIEVLSAQAQSNKKDIAQFMCS